MLSPWCVLTKRSGEPPKGARRTLHAAPGMACKTGPNNPERRRPLDKVRHAALRVRVAGERLVVASPDLVNTCPHGAEDQVLIERADHLGLGLAHGRDVGAATAEVLEPAAAAVAAGLGLAGRAAAPDEAGITERDGAIARGGRASPRRAWWARARRGVQIIGDDEFVRFIQGFPDRSRCRRGRTVEARWRSGVGPASTAPGQVWRQTTRNARGSRCDAYRLAMDLAGA